MKKIVEWLSIIGGLAIGFSIGSIIQLIFHT